MKARLVEDGAEPLGGEFFLADDWLVHTTWTAGRVASEAAQRNVSTIPAHTASASGSPASPECE